MEADVIAKRLELALEGARKVAGNSRGWSTVSKNQIECMAFMLVLLFDEAATVEAKEIASTKDN